MYYICGYFRGINTMEVIFPEFKDENEKNTMLLVAVLTILAGIIAPIIVFFVMRETLSPAANEVNKALLNFEILMVILVIFCTIPIIGWLAAFLLAPFITIAHFVVTIIATLCIVNNQPIKIWAPIKFIK